ncbi:MAG: protein-L-isoaspartate O-methyltransferase [Alphaproteobacteria bacterium]|nr:protein-L-isoaspartate O-methyltransferase [Alphaproteobacteria bacterium]
MTDFAEARLNMVESQVRPNGVTDSRILDAMMAVARERFVPRALATVAYADSDLPLKATSARALMAPMTFARLVQLAAIGEGDRVLHVGAAAGYGSAVLANVAGAVVALEGDGELSSALAANLAGLPNVTVASGKLAEGDKTHGPYDVILVEGRIAAMPKALLAQLKDGGRAVAVCGPGEMAKACVWTASGETTTRREAFDAAAALLPGFEAKAPAFVF